MDELRQIFAGIEAIARRELREDGIPQDRQRLERSLEMKYPLQIHQVEVMLGEDDDRGETAEGLVRRFTERYEQLYGRGSAWTGTGIVEVVACRMVARGSLLQPELRGVGGDASDEERERTVHWIDADGSREERATRVVTTAAIGAGETIEGPAIIEADTTTVVVPPDTIATATPHGDLTLRLQDSTSHALGAPSASAAF
jgi:N-methylhydantoinase A